MNLYPTTYSDAIKDEQFNTWMEILKENFIKSEFKEEKAKVVYHWGFFVNRPDDVSKEDFYQDLYTKYEFMPYEERLEEELAKVRVNIVVEYGKLIFSNRLDSVPDDITLIVTEITKIKMLHECKVHGHQNILDSIPPIDSEIIGYDEFEVEGEAGQIVDEHGFEFNYDVDEILDKISREGIESLTNGEREFLKNLSDGD